MVRRMGRDLLYKPPVPIIAPDENEGKPDAKAAAKVKSRELGHVGKTFEKPAGAPVQEPGKTPAYKASYFNADTSGLGQVNLRQSKAQALRGSDTAMDLRKIVLPPPVSGEAPDPARLQEAGALMGLTGDADFSLAALIGRQSAWLKGKGVTAEAIAARLAQLTRMVADRKRALARMLALRRGGALPATTLAQAALGDTSPEPDDVAAAGAELVERTASDAERMHRLIANMLGVKR